MYKNFTEYILSFKLILAAQQTEVCSTLATRASIIFAIYPVQYIVFLCAELVICKAVIV